MWRSGRWPRRSDERSECDASACECRRSGCEFANLRSSERAASSSVPIMRALARTASRARSAASTAASTRRPSVAGCAFVGMDCVSVGARSSDCGVGCASVGVRCERGGVRSACVRRALRCVGVRSAAVGVDSSSCGAGCKVVGVRSECVGVRGALRAASRVDAAGRGGGSVRSRSIRSSASAPVGDLFESLCVRPY